MTPEQIADFHSQVAPAPAPTVNLDEDAFNKMDEGQLSEFKSNFSPDTKINIGKSTAPKGEKPIDLDPETFKRMTPAQLADFSRQTKFSPYTWAQLHRDQLDEDTLQKLGEADVESRKRGFTFSDIPWESVKDAVPSLVKGLYQYGKLTAKNAPALLAGEGSPFGTLIRAATGEKEYKESPAETKSLAEQTAATEGAAVGLADLARRTFNKTGRFFLLSHKPLDQYTPEDSKELFKNELAIRDQLGEVFAGKGEVTTAAGGPELKKLLATGVQLNPETIAEASAGDPISFMAFSGGFKIFNAVTGKALGYAATRSAALQTLAKLKAIRGVVSKAEAAAADIPSESNISAANRAVIGQGAERAAAGPVVAGLEQAQILGEQAGKLITEAPAVAIGRTIQGFGKAVGTIPTIEKRAGSLGIVAELARGDVPGALGILATRAVRPLLEKGAGALESLGKTIAERNAPGGTWARAVEDLSKVPGTVIGGAAKAFPMDFGLMALSSETPEEQRESPFMATALGAAHALLLGGKGFVRGQTIAPRPWAPSNSWSRSYGNFPALDAVHAETMHIASDGVKQRLGALRDLADTTGTEVFQFSGEDQLARFFESQGHTPEDAASLARNNGMIIAKMRDRNGDNRQVILLRDPASAPHEVSHSIEDALTQDQQTAYYNELEKAHGTENVLKLAQDEANAQISTQNEADEASLNWKNFLLRKTGDGPAAAAEKVKTDPSLAGKPWDLVLTEDEKTELVKLYALKEIGADAMAAVLKNKGAAADVGSPTLKIAARTIGALMTVLGADPYAGVTEGTRGVELKPEALSAAEEAAQPFLIEARARKQAAGRPTVPLEPTPRATPRGTPPATPEERAAAAEGIRAEAAVASDTTPPAPGAQSPREILGTMADAAEQGAAVRSKYFGARGEETTADPDAKREQRRREVEAARNLPDSVRQLFDRIGFPYGLDRTRAGALQILDWSPEILASNAMRWAKALNSLPADSPVLREIPFELDRATGEFTANGWRQLFDAAEKFSRNQLGGFTGSGKQLTVPNELTREGLFQPPQTGTAEPLDQNAADFINTLYSLRPPKTPRAGRATPRNITAQVVSKATTEALGEPGRVVKPSLLPSGAERQPFAEPRYGISEIAETNPLRARMETELQKAGIALPDTIEAVRRLNLDRIHSVELETAQPKTAGGNVLTLQAGFQGPEATATLSPVDKAAVRDESGRIWTGSWHGEAFMEAATAPGERGSLEEGFVDKDGNWLTREGALKRAQDIKQVGEYKTYHQGYLESDEFSKNRRFQAPEKEKNPKAIKSVAVRDDDTGEIHTGLMHAQIFSDLVKKHTQEGTFREGQLLNTTDGFITNDGEFLDREQALNRATELGQIKKLPELAKKFGALESKEFAGARKFQGPVQSKEVTDLAESYAKDKGIEYTPPKGYVAYPRETAKKLAKFYDDALHSPDDPKVKASYDAFKQETLDQWKKIEAAGYDLEPVISGESPYKNGADVARDVENNKHLFFNLSESAFGQKGQSEVQLMLEPAGVSAHGKELNYNDIFRAVHDFFGHAKESLSFGPRGEFNAWREHASLYSPEAQGALAAETIGQTAWTQMKPSLLNAKGELLKPGEAGFVPRRERPYAEQKNFVMPEELVSEAKGVKFQAKKRESDPLKFAPAGKNPFEGSKAWILPNGTVEQLGGQWHHDWLDQNKEIQKKYGLKIPPFEGGDTEGVREQALQKGFSRVNLTNGSLTVEARQRDWRNIKPIVEDMVEKNLDDIDKMRIFLFDDKVDKLVKSNSGNIFDADTDAEKSQRALDIINGQQTAASGVKFQAPEQSDFENADTLPEALSKPGWAILTGTREKIEGENASWDDPRNIAANAKLKQELTDKGYDFTTVGGTYKGKPQGDNYLVTGISPYDAQAFGKKYGQESVVLNKGFLYGDGTITPGRPEDVLIGPEARRQDHFSTTEGGLDFSIPMDFKETYKPVGEQEQLFGGREYVSPADLTQAELKERYPEAIVPKNSKEKIASDIVGSPLYRKSDNPVRAFADKLVAFAKANDASPEYQAGLKWYSDFVPLLKKHFGKDAPMMAELLAASSPNETPTQNFFYAVDALEGFKSGRFDKIIEKYDQGFDMMKSDNWQGWYNKELKAGNIPSPPATPTPEAFLAHWIYKHGLKPKQSNGALYGFHGKAILEVMARKWLLQNKGPKVANFVQNLLGIGHGATVDVWLDRTMRRIGYAEDKGRWRILPKNGEGVSDADFSFAQKTMEEAAKELNLLPDALQGGLWFAEKKLWAENGWGRLDLGSYVKELENLQLIRQSVKQRLKTTALKKKVVPMESMELGL